MIKNILLTTSILTVTALPALAQHHHHHRGDSTTTSHEGHTNSVIPASVMGGHTHGKGDLMLSYTPMYMSMDGMINGSGNATKSEAFANGYMMAMDKMTMEMHMLGVMYGLSDDVTLMAMGMYQNNQMEMVNAGGMRMKMSSYGFTDTEVHAFKNIEMPVDKTLVVGLGVSLPTGSIDEKNSAGAVLPYGMQLGSGTFDLIPSATYSQNVEGYTVGVQAKAKLRTYDNERDYRLGNEYTAKAWVGKKVLDDVSVYSGLSLKYVDEIDGADSRLMANASPMADASQYGGSYADFNLGSTWEVNANNNISAEVVIPTYAETNGIQGKTDYSLMLKWKINQ